MLTFGRTGVGFGRFIMLMAQYSYATQKPERRFVFLSVVVVAVVVLVLVIAVFFVGYDRGGLSVVSCIFVTKAE